MWHDLACDTFQGSPVTKVDFYKPMMLHWNKRWQHWKMKTMNVVIMTQITIYQWPMNSIANFEKNESFLRRRKTMTWRLNISSQQMTSIYILTQLCIFLSNMILWWDIALNGKLKTKIFWLKELCGLRGYELVSIWEFCLLMPY